ncbi:MAG: replication-associated recombination protein A [Elusimicrobiales bacterium]|nr:replication-associated recombination protein A [Elusimicrobiales bacterium]
MTNQGGLFANGAQSGGQPDGAGRDIPLSARFVPESFEDYSGQEALLGEGKMLRRFVEADRLRSAVFFGPPGSGKTALARFIASKTKATVHEINAAATGTAELKEILKQAKMTADGFAAQSRILVILDEIHHFNRSQQDILLPSVERGDIILIGLTTENPFFYINNALISRFGVFEFQPLSTENLMAIAGRAVANKNTGLGAFGVELQPEVASHLATQSAGDARKMLNSLELAALTTKPDKNGKRVITLAVAEESIQKRSIRYDRSSDDHYDHISAFIKSMRGSDPDAALYWLAKMLTAGEDPRFIARRVFICASEDVGNADPVALMVAQSAFNAAEVLGMPEARIPLAQAVTYVACAPKSNAAYLGVEKAIEEVKTGPAREVPLHLRDANMDGKARGHGKGYKYPHDFPGHHVAQEYMPDHKIFYEPTAEGREAAIAERLKKLRGKK